MKTKRQRERAKSRRASATDRAERQKSGQRPYLNLPDGVKLYTFDKEGTRKIDIIEYKVGAGNPNAKKGELFYEYTFWVHNGIGPDNEKHICLAKTYGKKCPVCQHRNKLARDPEDHEDELKDLKPSERQMFRIKVPKKRKLPIQILEISNFFFGKELDAAIRKAKKKLERKRVDKFASPDEGMTVVCEVEEGSYQGRANFRVKLAKLVPREEQYDEDLSSEGPCLEKCLKPLDYDELKELFAQSGEDEEEDEDLDDDDTDDDDDDNSEDEDEDSDDEDDEDEDSDDEDDEDDDEEDEDDEDDDEDDEEDEEEISVGSVVKFTYKGKKLKGSVKRMKRGMAYVKSKNRTDPYIMDPADLTLVS